MVWGLMLNMISHILHLAAASPLALGVGVSFFSGIKHSSVDGHSAMSGNFGILTKENRCMSYYSIILALIPHHNGVITYLESENLECEVKWDLGSITKKKDSEGDGIPAELFQNLKDDAVKVLHLIYQQFCKNNGGHRIGKKSVFIPIPKKGNAKEYSNYHTIKLISHDSKIMLKILQTRLQQYVK